MAKVVVVGSGSKHSNISKIMQGLVPEYLPKKMLKGIYLYTLTDEKYSMDLTLLSGKSLTIDQVEDYLEKTPWSKTLRKVEIVIDLDIVEKETSNLTAELFGR